MGELDSAEESDEISNEFDFQQEVLHVEEEEEKGEETVEDISDENAKELGERILSEGSQEMLKYLNNIEKWSEKSRKTIVKKLLEQIVGHKPDQIVVDALKELNKINAKQNESSREFPDYTLGKLKSKHYENDEDREGGDNDYDDTDAKETDGNVAGEVDHFFHNGKFNQKNQAQHKEDKSNEETRSSWSSSEEALAACEGAIFNIPLNGATKCNANATFYEMRPIMSNISYVADTTGCQCFITVYLYNFAFLGL